MTAARTQRSLPTWLWAGVWATLTALAPGCGAPDDPQLPPTGRAAVLAWLSAGHYRGWACETDSHPPRYGGPHGTNRVCSNTALSQEDGPSYAAGAATVKELIAADGSLAGHSLMRKNPDGSWYWFEALAGRVYADGVDEAVCSGCHDRAGSTPALPGKDLVFTQVR